MPIATRRRTKVRGVQFTAMVVGQYMDKLMGIQHHTRFPECTVFWANKVRQHPVWGANTRLQNSKNAHLEENVSIRPVTVGEFDVFRKNLPPSHPRFVELEEDGLRISLTIVDTPCFGDNIDNRNVSVKSVSHVYHGPHVLSQVSGNCRLSWAPVSSRMVPH